MLEITDLIKKRVSCRTYADKPMETEVLREVSLQDIDLGIAMSHFDLTIQELGLQGKWQVNSSAPQEKALEYIATWQKNI
jgi:hypothetical protein